MTGRRGDEEQAADGTALYRAVLENLADGIVVHDATGRIVSSNRAARELLGLLVDELTGLTSMDPRRHPVREDGTPFAEHEHPAMVTLATGAPVTDVVMGVRHSSGETRWLAVGSRPLHETSHDGLAGVVTSIRDVTVQRDAEATLRATQTLAQHTEELGRTGGWTLILEPRRMTWTDGMFKIYELPPDHDPNDAETNTGLVAPEDRPRALEAYRRAIEDGLPYDMEMRAVTATGHPIWVRTNGVPEVRGGKVVALHGHFQDITERKRAEDAELVALGRLRRFVDAGIIGVIIANAAGAVLEANDYYLDLLGVTRDELEQGAVDWRAFTPPEWLPVDERALAELAERGICTPYEKEYLRRDGRRVWVLLTDAMLPAASPEIAAFVLDITDRKRAEEARRQSEREFHALVEAMPQLAWTTRPDGESTYFNQRWLDYTGLTLAEGAGDDWSRRVHPDDLEQALGSWRQATASGGVYELEARLRRADGAYRWWLIRGEPLRDGEGRVLKWIGTATDIEDLKQAAIAVQQSARLYATLSQVNQAIVRIKAPHDLYRAVCEVAVDFGGFVLAWVGLLDPATGDVIPTAASGVDVDPWPFDTVNTNGGPFLDGPVATAIRSHAVVTSEDLETDERAGAALGQIQGRDVHSVAAVPIQVGGVAIGAMVLVAQEAGFFTAASERDLLAEMGMDISFALDAMATEAARVRAEAARAESELRYRGLFEASPVALSLVEVICDDEGRPVDHRFLLVNPAFEQLSGVSAADLVGRTVLEAVPQADRAAIERQGQVALTGVPDQFGGFNAVLGSYWEATSFSPQHGQCVTYLVDVTERRLAERTSQRLNLRLTGLHEIDKAILAADSIDGVIGVALSHIRELLGCGRASVNLLDWAADESIVYQVSTDHTTTIPHGRRFPLASYADVIGALSAGRAFLIDDLGELGDERPALRDLVKDGMRSLASVPLSMRDGLVGMLSVYADTPAFFDDEKVEIAHEVADQVALAMMQQRLIEDLREREAALTQAQRIGRLGSYVLDFRAGTWTGSEELDNLMGIDRDYDRSIDGWQALVHPDDRATMADYGANDVAGEDVALDREYRAIRQDDQSERWMLSRAVVERDDRGRPKRLSGTILDITEVKRAEAQLAANAARLRILASASQALVEAGPDYDTLLERLVQELTDGLADSCQVRLLSEDGETLELAALRSLDPDASAAERTLGHLESLQADPPGMAAQVLLTGRPVLVPAIPEEQPAPARAPGPEPARERFAPHSSILVPLHVDGRTIGVLGLARIRPESLAFTADDLELAQEIADRAALAMANARLTRRVRKELAVRTAAEAEIRALNETLEGRVTQRTAALEAANRELEAFSYSVSHDLRAPLRHIAGFSEILVARHADQLDPEARRLLGTVVDSAKEMGVLIDDLLEFSRLARTQLDRRPVDMDGLVRSVLEGLRSGTPERQIRFDVGALCAVPGDPVLLRQVWANLLGNAVKFTGSTEAARIDVRCERASGQCLYTVRDNGVGFDAKDAGNLFQPFQRLHEASGFEGSGIGLAIVARIVQRHGGRVWADGSPGGGATFGFSLPEVVEAT